MSFLLCCHSFFLRKIYCFEIISSSCDFLTIIGMVAALPLQIWTIDGAVRILPWLSFPLLHLFELLLANLLSHSFTLSLSLTLIVSKVVSLYTICARSSISVSDFVETIVRMSMNVYIYVCVCVGKVVSCYVLKIIQETQLPTLKSKQSKVKTCFLIVANILLVAIFYLFIPNIFKQH